MATNRFWGWGEKIHSYNQITGIKVVKAFKAPNGNNVERPYYVIHFADGSSWSTKNIVYRADPDPELNGRKEDAIIAFIVGKSGKEVKVLENEED